MIKGFDHCLMGGCAREHRIKLNACQNCGHNREVYEHRLARIRRDGLAILRQDAWTGECLRGLKV